MKYEEVKTVEDLCDYIVIWAKDIYVRDQVDGKWDGYSLLELPAEKAIYHALRFIKEGLIPVRILADKGE